MKIEYEHDLSLDVANEYYTARFDRETLRVFLEAVLDEAENTWPRMVSIIDDEDEAPSSPFELTTWLGNRILDAATEISIKQTKGYHPYFEGADARFEEVMMRAQVSEDVRQLGMAHLANFRQD